MNPTALRPAVALLFAITALTTPGCGKKAAPQPPLLQVAQKTSDLAAFQEGVEAVVRWSYPTRTSAGGTLPEIEGVEVWRTSLPLGQEPKEDSAADNAVRLQILEGQGELLRTLDWRALERATRGPALELRDDLSTWYEANRERMPLVMWYAVRTVCCGGRVSPFSNIARLAPQPPPGPPLQLVLEPSADGITLTWATRPGLKTLIERSVDGRRWQAITADPLDAATWIDRGARQGMAWHYRLRGARALDGGGRVVGDPGAAVELEYLDTYPPAAPAKVVCLPEGETVRLRWEPVAGATSYRVFRQREGDNWRPLDLVTGHVWEDTRPQVGSLTYAVKAVDEAGNESETATCSTVVGHSP